MHPEPVEGSYVLIDFVLLLPVLSEAEGCILSLSKDLMF